MKDLGIYFNRIDLDHSYENKLGSKFIEFSADDFEKPESGSIAIIYVPEYRNSEKENKQDYIAKVHHALSSLKAGNWGAKIYSLGIIQPGNSIDDTYLALQEVVSELVKFDVFPLVIGGSQDLMYPIYKAYEKLEQTINILDIDCELDMGDPESPISDKGWLNKIILHKPTFLFNYSLFGYQSYFVSDEELDLLNKMYFDSHRLGLFYEDSRVIEPLCRNADILSFDMDTIRASDHPGNSRFLPHGFYGEDACKIMRYAALSDKLSSLGLFNLMPSETGFSWQDANLVAQMIWYFLEGFNQRKGDYPIGSKASYTKFRVSIDDFKDEIIFYKSDKSGRWWMEVPYPKVDGVKFQRHLLIPCNYTDYENALQNEMPNLWWKTYEKLS
ncbi:MAG: formimidoylglutamase [Flavobacteriales bacterium]|nr:formimidoylglutamase [Flavobacteriales bacterium]